MAKIAISLPDSLLKAIESKRKLAGKSRSDFFRQAAEALLRQEAMSVRQYVQGYREEPESPEEMGWLRGTSQAVLEEYRWNSEGDK